MTTLTLNWRVGTGGMHWNMTTGDWLYRDAVLVWKGQEQVRDITVRADGSISMGPDKTRRMGTALA